MTFDDDQEEVIEFIDSGFVYFFSGMLLYFCYKYSMHFFAFNEPSVSDRRSIFFLIQFKNDFMGFFGLMLRFYVLIFRLNMYDLLEDILDSYYIFLGDFDDDEYFNELFLSLHGTILFSFDNQDDRSFLFEDEHDFAGDFYYIYYLI
jgi:hypothetical protein